MDALNTQKNGWVSLGVVKLNGIPSISLNSVTADGRGEDDIAWDAVAIAPLAAKPANFVVALGDSYSSGEGASDPVGGDDYYKESDFGGALESEANGVVTSLGRNACHRSPFAWSRKAVLADNMLESLGARNTRLDTSLDFQLHACSGAVTRNINPSGVLGLPSVPSYGEVSQIDKGYSDENTTLVMLSLGGNDAHFGDIIKACVNPLLDPCQESTLAGQSNPLPVSAPVEINGVVKLALERTLREINKRAPNAKILLMGYPTLMASRPICYVFNISALEASWLNDMVTLQMNPMMQSLAQNLTTAGIPVTFLQPPCRL